MQTQLQEIQKVSTQLAQLLSTNAFAIDQLLSRSSEQHRQQQQEFSFGGERTQQDGDLRIKQLEVELLQAHQEADEAMHACTLIMSKYRELKLELANSRFADGKLHENNNINNHNNNNNDGNKNKNNNEQTHEHDEIRRENVVLKAKVQEMYRVMRDAAQVAEEEFNQDSIIQSLEHENAMLRQLLQINQDEQQSKRK